MVVSMRDTGTRPLVPSRHDAERTGSVPVANLLDAARTPDLGAPGRRGLPGVRLSWLSIPGRTWLIVGTVGLFAFAAVMLGLGLAASGPASMRLPAVAAEPVPPAPPVASSAPAAPQPPGISVRQPTQPGARPPAAGPADPQRAARDAARGALRAVVPGFAPPF